MTIEEVFHKYRDIAVPIRKRYYSESHVFDEEKSVRWNREEVLKVNDEIKKENDNAVLRYTEEIADWFRSLCDAVRYEYDSSWTDEKIRDVYDVVCSHADTINDKRHTLIEYLEMIYKFIN